MGRVRSAIKYGQGGGGEGRGAKWKYKQYKKEEHEVGTQQGCRLRRDSAEGGTRSVQPARLPTEARQRRRRNTKWAHVPRAAENEPEEFTGQNLFG